RPLLSQVITPFRKLMLCARAGRDGGLDQRSQSVQKWGNYEASQFNMEHFSGMHNWYACHTPGRPSATSAERHCGRASPPTDCPVK
ncbi:hypothetical protein INR49_017331, partial [Caranx melampygus]